MPRVAVCLASALPWGLGNVWRQSITYNSGAGPRYGKLSQFRKLLSTLGSRDLLVVGTRCCFALIRDHRDHRGPPIRARRSADACRRPRPMRAVRRSRHDAVISVWAVVTALVLVFEPALYRNHLAAIVPPLARPRRDPRSHAHPSCSSVAARPDPRARGPSINLHDILLPTGYTGAGAARDAGSLHVCRMARRCSATIPGSGGGPACGRRR